MAAAEIRRFAWNHGIPCRLILAGSGSIMAQLLGLTDVNRIFLNLFFERFRDPQGRWAPKFHFEVPKERRESVLDFANEHYGQEFAS